MSRDQLYLAARFLDLADEATSYLELLYEAQRSACSARRKVLHARIADLRRAAQRTDRHVRAEVIEPNAADLSAYYLDPFVPIIHMFLTEPRFAADPSAIAASLRISQAHVHRALETLLRIKVATYDGTGFRSQQDSLHLPETSPLYAAHKKILRFAALDRQEQLADGETYGFSAVFSANEATRRDLQRHIFAFIKNAQSAAGAGPFDEVYQLNIDLFAWSRGLESL